MSTTNCLELVYVKSSLQWIRHWAGVLIRCPPYRDNVILICCWQDRQMIRQMGWERVRCGLLLQQMSSPVILARRTMTYSKNERWMHGWTDKQIDRRTNCVEMLLSILKIQLVKSFNNPKLPHSKIELRWRKSDDWENLSMLNQDDTQLGVGLLFFLPSTFRFPDVESS